MNWTEGTLYRHNRGRLRKINPARQRQKEYFARARARAAEREEAEENGPPRVSYFQSSGRRSSKTPIRVREAPTTRVKTEPTEEPPLPTLSRFFQEQSSGRALSNPVGEYTEEALERMRQKLLAKKD
ncbi:hypothetical protein VTJ49DRAFT_442 [Mycothermus thermophilus]|uniref:Uncharacterized protein n=1 Tax=Humicola insolens TaxID=85995 RepID=A0ABR3VFW3_HUMIN